jgi:hypothetical protein
MPPHPIPLPGGEREKTGGEHITDELLFSEENKSNIL